jgi:hypothetical protein
MKKLVFVVLMVFALSAVYDTTFAAENSEYSKALKYYNSKKFKEAVELLKEQVQKNPTPSGYYLLGYALYKLGKFEEANEYFKEAYLLDPEFSLEKAGLIKKTPSALGGAKPEDAEKPSAEKVPDAEKPPVSETKEKQPEVKKEPAPAKQLSKEAKPQKPEAAKGAKEKPAPVTAEKKPSAQEPKKVEPQKVEPLKPMQSPSKIQSFMKFKKEPPFVATEVLIALSAGLVIIVLVVGVILYRKRRHKSDLPPAE